MTSPIAGEREAFEAWRRRTAKTANPDKAVALNGFGDDAQYDVPATRAMWTAWQARAALLEPVGEGWVMVPKEPTPEMVAAAFHGVVEAQDVMAQMRSRERMAGFYRAMIAASPKTNGGMGS